MMRYIGKKFALTVVSLSVIAASFAQNSGGVNVNTVTTAVPFLRIGGDARSGGMGDVGIALSPDANAAQLNGARMAFIEQDYGVGLSFTPWLRALVNDIYLTNLTGFLKVKDPYGGQVIHASLRYFSLGEIQYTDDYGNNTIQAHPNEFYFDAGYSRKFGDIVSIDATLRFIYSDIAPQASAGTNTPAPEPGIAGAADISVFVDKKFDNKGKDFSHEFLWGLCLSNIGSKMSYTSNTTKDFLPANLGIGFGYKFHLDAKDDNTIGIYDDLNKLLVPTPNQATQNNNGYAYSAHQQNEDPITGMITSFYDAPGGASEELKSIIEQVGAEYYYKKMFALRAGFFYEDPYKGGREYMTVGAGIHYSVATLNFCYNVPVTSQHNPLDNSFSFSLAFEFKKSTKKAAADPNAAPSTDTAPAAPAGKSRKGAANVPQPTTPQPASTPSTDPDPTQKQ